MLRQASENSEQSQPNMSDLQNLSAVERRLVMFGNLTLDTMQRKPGLVVVSNVLFWIVLVLGLMANILLAGIIFRHRKVLLKIPLNVLLLSVAICNLLCLITTMGLRISAYAAHEDIASASLVAKSEELITEANVMISNWTIALLVIFNYCGVTNPIQFRLRATSRKTFFVVVGIWIVACALCAPLLYVPKMRHILRENHINADSFQHNPFIEYKISIDLLSSIPLLLSIIILYPLILYHLRRTQNQEERSNKFRENIQQSVRHITMVYFVFVIYVSFDVVVTSVVYNFMLSDILDSVQPGTDIPSMDFFVALYDSFRILYAILNPILHALLTKNYKNYYVMKLCRKK